MKKILSIFIVLCMVISFVPMTTYAEGYGDKGYNTTLYDSFKIDGLNVFAYVTGNDGVIERISGGDNDSVQQYKAMCSDKWEFAYWSTYYVGPSTQQSNPVAVLGYYYFSQPGDSDKAYDKRNPVIQINEEMWARGTYYLQAIFKPKVTISVNKDLKGIGKSIRGNSTAEPLDNVFISGNSGYVPYGGNIEVTLTGIKADYMIESITVHDGAPRNDFTYKIDTEHNELKVNFIAERPTNVQINLKVKEQIVSYDANTGNGTMGTQMFESGVAEVLDANTFYKTGYLFDGWNTKADGSGTDYFDGQSVTFTPENDGDSITLFAQWVECEDHEFEDGVCSKCDLVCEHNYVYSSDENVLKETCSNGCDHNATALLEQDADVSTVYTGAGIKALEIIYSEDWKGGSLDVEYINNVNAGEASGTINKGSATATKIFVITKQTAPDIVFPTVQNQLTKGQKLKDAKLSFYENEYGVFQWSAPECEPGASGDFALNFYPNEDALKNFDWSCDTRWIADDSVLSINVNVVVNKLVVGNSTETSGKNQPLKTGDASSFSQWFIFVFLSGAVVGGSVLNNRKRRIK